VTYHADEVLKSSGSIAFNTPAEMRLGERTVIQLLLDPRPGITPEVLALQVTEQGAVQSAQIKISDSIEATISGAAFEIRAVTPEVQALSGEGPTEWKWEIKPREAGSHRLFLTINAIVSGAGGVKRSVRTFDRTIVVHVPPAALANWLREPVAWLALLVLAGVATGALLAIRRRTAPRPAESPIPGATATIATTHTPAPRTDFVPGEIVTGRYEIIRELGRGGMGIVYAAKDREFDGELVALKTIHPHAAHDPSALPRLKREIQYARKVAHRHVCRIFDVTYAQHAGSSVMFVSMEYIPGVTLSEHIRARGVMNVAEALPILEQVAAALTETHRVKLIHRDLKTANIMLAEEGRRAVLMDFGLACLAPNESPAASLTQPGAFVGSPSYMAPEQLEHGLITPAADIYAFGVVIYEMATAALPFAGSTPMAVIANRLHTAPIPPSQRRPSVDPAWERVIMRCLAREPANRYGSADEVVRALTEATQSLGATR
jgi:hypothetical protein